MSNTETADTPVTWRTRLMVIALSLIGVGLMITKVFNGPGSFLFNNGLFAVVLIAVFAGPMLISRRFAKEMMRARNDRIVRLYQLIVELPATIAFVVCFPGYWWLAALEAGTMILQYLPMEKLNRRVAAQAEAKKGDAPAVPSPNNED